MTKADKPSYRCATCVAEYRYTLVEFDELPLEKQVAFWAGVISKKILPVKSLVYSGNKSIHGLVTVGTCDYNRWKLAVEKLLFATCHPDAAKEYQADRACRNANRLTRLAGAYRSDTKKINLCFGFHPDKTLLRYATQLHL